MTIVMALIAVANIVFLSGKWRGRTDKGDEDRDEQDKRVDAMIAELRTRTHLMSSQLQALPTELAKHFMPREVAEVVFRESAEDRRRMRDDVEALWKELRMSRSRPRQ